MGKSVAFVGGKLSIKNRLFTDSPMHAECAIYALQVCPFLAMRKFGYVTHHNEDEVHVNQLVSNNRPEVFGMGIAEKYKIVPISPTDIAIKAGIFKSLTLWRHGEQVRSWNIAAPQ